MIETATAINTLPSAARQAGFESPSEQLITLTYGQLQGLIVQAVQEAIQPLQDRIEKLESAMTNTFVNQCQFVNPPELESIVAPQSEISQLREERDQDRPEIAALRAQVVSLEKDIDVLSDNQLIQLRLIHELREKKKEHGKTETTRAEKIERYLAARPDHKATFETLRGHLGVDKFALNDAIKTLMEASPGRFGITRTPGDKRKRALIMLPR
jgi:chromosome segregation ATPase